MQYDNFRVMVKKILIFNIFILLLSSCVNSYENYASKIIKKWSGKEIVFPNENIFTSYANDTVSYKIPQANYKILVYVDSIGCISCKLKLNKQKNMLTIIKGFKERVLCTPIFCTVKVIYAIFNTKELRITIILYL